MSGLRMPGYPSYDYPADDNEKLDLLFLFLFKFKGWHFLNDLLESLDWKIDYIQKLHVKQLLIKSGDVVIRPYEDAPYQFKIKDEVILAISKYGSYKKYRISKMNNRELKHLILSFLYTDQSKNFSIKEIENALLLDYDKTLSLIDEMFNKDDTVYINDSTAKGEHYDYSIKINPKGIGYFLDKEYLKEEKTLPLASEIHFGDKITTHGNESPAFGKSGTQNINIELDRLRVTNKQLDDDLKEAQLELTNLQIREAKRKKLYALIGFIAGVIVTHLKEIVELLKKLFHQ